MLTQNQQYISNYNSGTTINSMNSNSNNNKMNQGTNGSVPMMTKVTSNLSDQENVMNNYQNMNGNGVHCNPVNTIGGINQNKQQQFQNIPPQQQHLTSSSSSLITQSMVIGRVQQQQQISNPMGHLQQGQIQSQIQVPQEPIIVKEIINSNNQQIVRQYRQGEFLGKGGFAKCYLMTEIENNRIYAAKIIPKASLQKSRARAKLKSEIKIHSSLDHENIVKFEHCFENEENVYILLGLCNQKTVMDLHKKRKYVHEYEAKYYLYQVIMAVKYLHAQKVIHRDLKLGNLFIDNMRIKLGDFGLSTKIEHDGERKKTICGTPNYIAPEILENSSGHSYEVDIWSIGIILYTLLIGKPPFETPDVKNTYQRIRKNQYAFPQEPVISHSAKSLIVSILNPVPEKRPNLTQILEHDFFSLSTIPKSLPVSSLTIAPPAIIRPLTEKTNSLLSNITSPNKNQPTQQQQQYQYQQQSPQKKQHNNNPISTLSPNSKQKLADLEKDDLHHRKLRRLERIKENDMKTKLLKQQFINTTANFDQGVQSQQQQHLENTTTSTTTTSTADSNDNNQIRDLEAKIANNHITEGGQSPENMSDYMMIDEDGQSVEYTTVIPSSLIYIIQYSDFTNKYGIGYILSNGFVGSYFNDSTKIISYIDSGLAHYLEHAKGTHGDGRRILNIFENHPHDTQKKVTLIRYFSNILNQSLSSQQSTYLNTIYANNKFNQDGTPVNNNNNSNTNTKVINVNSYLHNPVYIKKWIKTPNGMGFRLSDRTIQVNFPDKSIIIITFDQMVTYITSHSTSKTAKLSYFLTQNDPKIVSKIVYAKELLYKLYSKKPEVMFSNNITSKSQKIYE